MGEYFISISSGEAPLFFRCLGKIKALEEKRALESLSFLKKEKIKRKDSTIPQFQLGEKKKF